MSEVEAVVERKLTAVFLIILGVALGFLTCFALAKPQVDSLSAKARALASKVEELSSYVDSLEARVEGLIKENQELRTRLSQAEARAAELEAELARARSEAEQLRSRISALEAENQELREERSALASEVEELKRRIVELESEKAAIETKLREAEDRCRAYESAYNELREAYEALSANYTELLSHYNETLHDFHSLLSNLNAWLEYAWSFSYFTNETVRRLFNEEQIARCAEVVRATEDYSPERALRWTYEYILDHVDYARDEPMPDPPGILELLHGNYTNTTVEEVFMSPADTLRLGQGDCDDMAFLAYALILAYQEASGKRFPAYLFFMKMSGGFGHAAVIAKLGGKVMIVDPAGKYVSSRPSDPRVELASYEAHWSKAENRVVHVELVLVDASKLKAYTVYRGSLQGLAEFLTAS